MWPCRLPVDGDLVMRLQISVGFLILSINDLDIVHAQINQEVQ